MGGAIVHRVDHFFVPLDDVERGWSFLTETLQLPVAWSLDDWGGFTGGVDMGNANMELLRTSPRPFWEQSQPSARVRGIAFEPVHIDDAFLAELDRRGIGHSAPMPWPADDGSNPSFTNVAFDEFVAASATVFACEYHVTAYPESKT